ncbi:MAG TPA: universal stress protein [Bryobacteraceae bacterium]|nr:universal stress protein [Bryobacteraceae bacterium]
MAFRNILFPVDFSEACEAIAPHVRSLCERFQGSLTLAHFIYIPAVAYGAIDAAGPVVWPVQEFTDNAEKRIEAFSAKFFAGLNPGIVVREGDAAACITDLAASHPFDLIMMPTHGYGRVRALLLGSVTAKTLHDAPCAVWTASQNAKQRPAAPWKKILCAIDADEEGERLLREAAELSENGKIGVRVIHAVPSPAPVEDPFADSSFSEFLLRCAETSVARLQTAAGTSFEARMKPGRVPDVVRDEAEDWDADVVLIGRGVLPRFAGQFRSHAYSIIRTMPCPVLSV